MKREFDRKIWKSGNSFVVTIPSETVERYGLENKFVTVAITDEDSRITNNKYPKIAKNNNTKDTNNTKNKDKKEVSKK